MLRLLALDFDGVISDSAPESFLVAVRTFRELRPAGRLDAELARIAQGGGDRAPAREEVSAHPLYAAFLELMPLGNRAEDYGVILAALEAGARIADQAGYDAWRDGLDREYARGPGYASIVVGRRLARRRWADLYSRCVIPHEVSRRAPEQEVS